MSPETIVSEMGVMTPAWESDIEVAALSGVPVLISAGPIESEGIACRLSRRSPSPHPAMRIVDCRGPEGAAAVRSLTGSHKRRAAPEILLLQEIYALDHAHQALLEQQVEKALLHPEVCSPVRLLASSSVPLFDRVTQQSFRERLYYLLNMIHIELPSESRPPSQAP